MCQSLVKWAVKEANFGKAKQNISKACKSKLRGHPALVFLHVLNSFNCRRERNCFKFQIYYIHNDEIIFAGKCFIAEECKVSDSGVIISSLSM